MTDRSTPPILLVRLKTRGLDGAAVGESRRVCHLVPVPQSGDLPDALRAYCGAEIPPGAAELLTGMSGMPCELCLARSPIPAFAMLRTIPPTTAGGIEQRHDVAAWWDLVLQPEQKIAARFVLLLLLQDPSRHLSVGEIALWLGQSADTVNLIVLLHAAVGWVKPIGDSADPAWVDRRYRLTERGVSSARRLLAQGLTPTFTLLATRMDLDTTVVSDRDAADPETNNASQPRFLDDET